MRFITGNKDKLREVRDIIGADIKQLDVDLPEIQEMDARVIIEDKLERAFVHHDGPFIVEDTSLHIDGLNGLPGPLVKWFLQAVGNAGVVEMARASGDMQAQAKTIVGYARSADDVRFFTGSLSGKVVAPRGKNGFGWDPIFQPQGKTETFAEMGDEEKNILSMRRRAFEKLHTFLNK
jgi:non-canonical purine NTP pyrophosphatase (RdgB/HAM1 family)